MRFANRRRSFVERTSLNIRSRVTTLLRRSSAPSVRPTVAFRLLPWSQLGARLRFSLSSSAKHMTATFPKYRSSDGRSSGTELIGHKTCHMLISTKKNPPIDSSLPLLKPRSIRSTRGNVRPPRASPPNERPGLWRRVSLAPRDRPRRRGSPVQSVEKASPCGRASAALNKRSRLKLRSKKCPGRRGARWVRRWH